MPKSAFLRYLLGARHVEQFDRNAEFDVLVLPRQGEHFNWRYPAQGVDDVADHDFGRRGAGGDADNLDVVQPLPV